MIIWLQEPTPEEKEKKEFEKDLQAQLDKT